MKNLLSKLLTPTGLFFTVLLFLVTLKTHRTYMGQGDEPHYIVVSESLLFDQDLDLRNNYRSPYLRPFDEAHAVKKNDGRWVPFHGIGLSILGTPVLAVERLAYKFMPEKKRNQKESWILTKNAFSFSMMVLAGFMAILFRKLFLTIGLSDVWAGILSLFVTTNPPISSYGFLFFTELPCVFFVTMLLLRSFRNQPVTIADALMAGFMPWLHLRYGLLAAFLLFVRWNERRRKGESDNLTVPLMGTAVLWAGFLAMCFHLWGKISAETTPLSKAFLPVAIPALFFDRSFGLFVFAPFYMVAIAGLFLLLESDRRWFFYLAGGMGAVLAPVSAFPIWWGGWSPGPRYLVAAIPFLIMGFGIFVKSAIEVGWSRRLVQVVLGIGFVWAALYWQDPRLFWNDEKSGINGFLMKWFGVIGEMGQRALPNFFAGKAKDFYKAIGWAEVIVVANVFLAKALAGKKKEKWS